MRDRVCIADRYLHREARWRGDPLFLFHLSAYRPKGLTRADQEGLGGAGDRRPRPLFLLSALRSNVAIHTAHVRLALINATGAIADLRLMTGLPVQSRTGLGLRQLASIGQYGAVASPFPCKAVPNVSGLGWRPNVRSAPEAENRGRFLTQSSPRRPPNFLCAARLGFLPNTESHNF